jgi:hypothetical protein
MSVALEQRKHASLDIYFEIDNLLRGKVYDPQGKPMKEVCLQLVPALVEASRYFYKADCTDEAGRFAIREVPAGSYYLVANEDGGISSTEPFKKLYYPGVSEREKAAVVTIGAGETLEGFDVRVPHAEEWVTVEGVLLYSDGKPVVRETVEFTSETVKSNFDGAASATTDAWGRFSIKILKGFEGVLYGEMFSYIGEFEKCPKLEAIIKKAGDTSLVLRTDAIKLQGEHDLKDLELRFPFPGCKKAKSENMK